MENKIRSNIVDQKLKTVPADLSRLSHVLDNDVVTSGLFTKTVWFRKRRSWEEDCRCWQKDT